MKKDKIIIISHYHFLCKSESENSVSFWFCSVSFHQIEVQFCLISWKMNLILFHFTEKRFSSVSSHQKKIWFCLISQKKNLISFWFWLRTELNQNEKSWFLQSAYLLQCIMTCFIIFLISLHRQTDDEKLRTWVLFRKTTSLLQSMQTISFCTDKKRNCLSKISLHYLQDFFET